jgi:hypothetical protein
LTTDELIRELREQTNTNGCWNDGCWNKCKRLMTEAADRLEELDERNAILLSNMDNAWGNNYG